MKLPKAFDTSLTLRTLLQLALISLVMIGIVGFVMKQYSDQQIYKEINDRANMLIHTLQTIIDIEGNSKDLIRAVNALGSEADIISILVAEEKGDDLIVIAATDNAYLNKSVNYLVSNRNFSDSASDILASYNNEEGDSHFHDNTRFESVLPIMIRSNDLSKTNRGIIHLAIDTTVIYKLAIHKLINLWLMLAVSIFITLCLFYIVMRRNVSYPIYNIRNAIDARAKGISNAYATVFHGDEIGVVAKTFNSMVDFISEGETRLKAIVDNTVDGLITIDEFGTVETYNLSCERIFGYKAEEVIGQNIKMLMPEPYRAEHDGYLKKYRETGERKVIGIGRSVMGKRKDGSTFHLELSVSEVNISGRKIYSGVVRDITERIEHEIRTKMYTEELEIAKQQADSANQMKSEFLATMSHEIRTPMNGIIGMAELMSETSLSNKQHGYLRTIMSSAESLLIIINDILDFSKIEAGKVDLEPLPIDLIAIAEDVADLMTIRARERNLELIVRVLPDVKCNVIGDPTRIRQIISNLLGNAIKFTEKGYVVLQIENDKELSDKTGLAGVRVSVTDTGIGIPEAAHKRLFQKFMQADSSTTRKFGGTGLGLAICKKLVEMMGGEIGVRSVVGKGSTFSFTMALPIDNNKITEQPNIDILKDLKILFVDDIEINLMAIKDRFKIIGIDCDICNSAANAVSTINNAFDNGIKYDVIIIDYNMPEINGIDLGNIIKSDPKFIDINLIMLAQSLGQIKLDYLKEVGFSGCLQKSFRIRNVIDLISLIVTEHEKGNKNIFVTEDDLAARRNFYKLGDNVTFKSPEILLAEDNRVNQGFAIEILESVGCKVSLAVNGKLARDMYEARKYDLVFMDCEMPEMNGFEATQAIRDIEITKDSERIPIIALTANAMSGDREKCFAAGMDDHLAKPMRKNDLLQILAKWLPNYIVDNDKTAEDIVFQYKRVLLVEDNRTNRLMAEEMLSEFDMEITVAENGSIAVDLVDKNCFDVIFMDCQMPVMDGFEATRHICNIKKNKMIKDMPIIALTANALKGDREKCLDAGMDDYITKPLRRHELRNVLQKWLGKNNTEEKFIYKEKNTAKLDVLNLDTFEEVRELMHDNFYMWVKRYIEDAKQNLSDMDDARENEDVSGIYSAVHNMRSTSHMIGAMRLSAIAERIEIITRSVINNELSIDDIDSEIFSEIYSVFVLSEQAIINQLEAIHELSSKDRKSS